jgi:serine/threonine protein kinase
MPSTAANYNAANGMPPNRFGAYQIEGPLGQGAVARVFRAKDRRGQEVALKVMLPAAASQAHLRSCFQLEYRVLSRLRHRGIARVYDSGEINGLPYMAMQLINGETLEDFLLRTKTIGEVAAIDIVRQIADALDYLHENGYVHRDIKTSNIMLTRDGRAVLFDFGTVYEIDNPPEHEMGIYGTPAFLAPEQIDPDQAVDGRADLYALGIVLYRMLSGQKPFYGARAEVLEAHLHQPPPPPSKHHWVSPEVEQVILKAIAKDPDERFQSGQALIDALTRAELEPAPPKPELGQRLFGWLRAGS